MKATRPREVVNFAHLRVPFVFCNQFTIILPALPLSSPVLVLKISILGCATCTELHAMLWNCNTKTIIYRNTIMEFGNTNQFWCSGILNKSRPMSSISFTRDFQPCSEWTNEHYTACRNTNQHHAPPPPPPLSFFMDASAQSVPLLYPSNPAILQHTDDRQTSLTQHISKRHKRKFSSISEELPRLPFHFQVHNVHSPNI